jgi:hypothetical protein
MNPPATTSRTGRPIDGKATRNRRVSKSVKQSGTPEHKPAPEVMTQIRAGRA